MAPLRGVVGGGQHCMTFLTRFAFYGHSGVHTLSPGVSLRWCGAGCCWSIVFHLPFRMLCYSGFTLPRAHGALGGRGRVSVRTAHHRTCGEGDEDESLPI